MRNIPADRGARPHSGSGGPDGLGSRPGNEARTAFRFEALTGVTVGQFIDADPNALPGDYTATINWGDGTSSPADSITQPNGPGTPFVVSGSHTYTQSGTLMLQVRVTDPGYTRTTFPSNVPFTISDNGGSQTTIQTPLSVPTTAPKRTRATAKHRVARAHHRRG